MFKSIRSWAMLGTVALFLASCGEKPQAKDLSAKQLAEQNKPATVLIQANHKAEIAVPDYEIPDGTYEKILYKLKGQVERGQIETKEQLVVKMIEEVLKKPLEYMQPTNDIIRQDAEVTGQGTGFIVTEDGYIVTNAHVVTSEGEQLKQELADSSLKEIAVSNCKKMWSDLDDYQAAIGSELGTQEFIKLCLSGSLKYYRNYMKISDIDTKIYTAIGPTTADADLAKTGYVSTVKKLGKPAPGKDVAILKIEAENLPTVNLGEDDALQTGDPLYVLGYPGGAVVSSDKAIEPSLTAGLVSARQTMPDGWEALQTNTDMNPGNSGGPVLNQHGEVIGIATFSKVDPRTGNAVQGVNFAIPMSVATEFLKESNIQPAGSELSQQYTQGIEQLEQGKLRLALQTFQKIRDINSKFPYVEPYISKVQSLINTEGDQSLPTWAYGVAVLGLLAMSGTAGYLVLMRRSRQLSSMPLQLNNSQDAIKK